MKAAKKNEYLIVVEDSDDDYEITLAALEQGSKPDLEIFRAKNAHELMSILTNQTYLPKLIIMDLNLPGQDGTNILAELKENSLYKELNVVILTTSDHHKDAELCELYGAKQVLHKNIDMDKFFSDIAAFKKLWF